MNQDYRKLSIVLKKYFSLSASIFFLFFCLGFIFSLIFPEIAGAKITQLQKEFDFINNLSPLSLGIFIFLNNFIKISIFIFLGVLFAIPTIFFLTVNGFLLGFVFGFAYPIIGLKESINALIYHGTFELTALFIGSSLGIYLGKLAISEIRKKNNIKSLLKLEKIKSHLLLSVKTIFFIILPLLAIAAIIEAFLIVSH